jgi:hypothetical protein
VVAAAVVVAKVQVQVAAVVAARLKLERYRLHLDQPIVIRLAMVGWVEMPLELLL